MRKPAPQRKREIVGAVLDLAAKGGPDRLTMQAVADAVDLTQPAIFRHFPAKKDLWVEVARSIAEDMTQCWQGVLCGAGGPEEKLAALVSAQLSLLESRPAILAIVFSHELQFENADLRRIFHGLMMQFHGHLQGLLADGRSCARAGVDPVDAAFLIVALVQGLALRWSLTGRTFSLAGEGRRLLELQLAGLNAPAGRSTGEGTAR